MDTVFRSPGDGMVPEGPGATGDALLFHPEYVDENMNLAGCEPAPADRYDLRPRHPHMSRYGNIAWFIGNGVACRERTAQILTGRMSEKIQRRLVALECERWANVPAHDEFHE